MPFEQSRDILLKRRGSGRKHFIIISGLLNTKRNIISKKTNDHIAVWEGEKLTKERALAVTGIKQCIGCKILKVLFEMMTHAETIYINTNEHYRAAVETETREARFVKWWKEKYQHIPLQKATQFYNAFVR
jgi:Xaa-Pro aminopeptidase